MWVIFVALPSDAFESKEVGPEIGQHGETTFGEFGEHEAAVEGLVGEAHEL